jgi:hypothetical protein
MQQVTERSLDEVVGGIVAAIVRELGGPTGRSLILPEAATRAKVMSRVRRLIFGEEKGSREQRRTAADIARSIDTLLDQLEPLLEHPLAPHASKRGIPWIAQMRNACRAEMQSRPKGGREVDHLKRYCAHHALHLMETLSSRKPSGSAESPFLVITALLFEATTGRRNASCRRACEYVIRHRRD